MLTEDQIATEVAQVIFQGFTEFLQGFRAITKQAKAHFERQEWKEIQADSKARLGLYKSALEATVSHLCETCSSLVSLDESAESWAEIKAEFELLTDLHPATEIAETFYNSVFCRLYQHQTISDDFMFVFQAFHKNENAPEESIFRSIRINENLEAALEEVLLSFGWGIPFANLKGELEQVADRLKKGVLQNLRAGQEIRLEYLPMAFFRNKGTYVLGRIVGREGMFPLLLPLLNTNGSIHIDALITDPNMVSIIFGFTRSYFLVDTDRPSAIVRFLKSLLPLKNHSELYNSIGFSKHGKTAFFREFTLHLYNSYDQFVVAPGIKGMVMAVFTLPSYNMVFKVIRDEFAPPKQMTQEQVKEKYRQVSRHDRIGRMADTHEFHNFTFDRFRFSKELIEELQKKCPSKLIITEREITITHLYTERRMIPLNMYLEKANLQQAAAAIDEYGKAIKQIAAINLFPGDMLLKNFGVTRHNRVVFYDYDEVCFLHECNFRNMPVARHYDDELSGDPWFSVGPNDVFPEEFSKFLVGNPAYRQIFLEKHPDLFTAKYWRELQHRLQEGEIFDVIPYSEEDRLGENG